MKQLIIISTFFLTGLTMNAFGQEVTDTTSNTSIIQQFYQYHIKYPNQAKIAGIEGTIILTFKIDSSCTFINRKQNIKLGYGCDDLVMETLDEMEKDFKKKNKNRCKYFDNTMSIPVIFELR